MNGIVFDIRKYSIHDGPGIRTAFFLKGCPLKCAWCHNPEGRSFAPELFLRPDRCLGASSCGKCAAVCPRGAAVPASGEGRPASSAPCSACGECAAVCPSGAREIIGRSMSVRDVTAAALEDEPFYDESGGGVTFTGGEPFAQGAFLIECLSACRTAGLRTAVDTCGFAPGDAVARAAGLADLFLFDLKHMDSREHERRTGVPNSTVLSNLRILVEGGAAVWIRIPLIPGVNDSRENLEATASYLEKLGFSHPSLSDATRAVQILPYHDSARSKYALRGLAYPMGEVLPPSQEKIEAAVEIFSSRGIPARAGG